jgi:ParB/RepB/Spo0J family partition protein
MKTPTDRPLLDRWPMMALPVDQVHPSATNPRKHFDETALAELAESIRVQGVLQPLLVRAVNEGYEIVAGERRFRAALAAGLPAVPAVVRELSDAEVLEIQVVENLQRSDLHPLEEAEGYQRLVDAARLDVARIAERIGRSVSYVYDRLRLLQLTERGRELFLEGKITAGHAVILSRLSQPDQVRAMDEDKGGLFSQQRLLWNPEAQEGDARDELKPMSVRELQAWVDKHVKFNPRADDLPELFPDTAEALAQAHEVAEKIIPITYDCAVSPDARDGSRVFGPRSWKRADGRGGRHGSKTCDASITGVVVVGPCRGEAFKVCVDKEHCKIHWAEEQRAVKKRAAAGSKTGKPGKKDRWAVEQEKRNKQRLRDEQQRARWTRARPEIMKAVAAKVAKAPVSAGGQLADLILHALCNSYRAKSDIAACSKAFPRGKSAEDLVRFAGMLCLFNDSKDYMAYVEFPRLAKAFGVDAKKIVDTVAPEASSPKEAVKDAPKKPEKKAAKKGKAAPGPGVKTESGTKAPEKPKLVERQCRECGCTDDDCRQCIDRTGEPCTWVEPDLCSACAPCDFFAGTPAVAANAPKKPRRKR